MKYHKDDEPRETIHFIEKNYNIEKPVELIYKPIDSESVDTESPSEKKFKVVEELLGECKKPIKIKARDAKSKSKTSKGKAAKLPAKIHKATVESI